MSLSLSFAAPNTNTFFVTRPGNGWHAIFLFLLLISMSTSGASTAAGAAASPRPRPANAKGRRGSLLDALEGVGLEPGELENLRAASALTLITGGLRAAGLRAEPDRLAALVVETLRKKIPSWAVDISDSDVDSVQRPYSSAGVTVKECSVGGANWGAFTFKVTAPGGGASVALRIADAQPLRAGIFQRCQRSAAKQLAQHGVAAKQLAASSADSAALAWSIEEWLPWVEGSELEPFREWTGNTIPRASAGVMTQLGRLLARVHAVPVDWFVPYRAEFAAAVPGLKDVPATSHLWWSLFFTGRFPEHNICNGALHPLGEGEQFQGVLAQSLLGRLEEEETHGLVKEFMQLGAFAPAHSLAARVVTAHGDLWAGNAIDCGEANGGWLAIDFETVHVGCAVFDLAVVVHIMFIKFDLDHDHTLKRAFLSSYLEAGGFPADDCDALLLDVILALECLNTGRFGVGGAWNQRPLKSADEFVTGMASAKRWAAWVRGSAEAQRVLLGEGTDKSWEQFSSQQGERAVDEAAE